MSVCHKLGPLRISCRVYSSVRIEKCLYSVKSHIPRTRRTSHCPSLPLSVGSAAHSPGGRRLLSPGVAMASCELIRAENVGSFVDSFDTILTDCDGVLWNDQTVIPGAAETIAKLRKMGKRIFFITNNSSKTRAEYVKKCNGMGFDAQIDDIIGSAYVTAQYIKEVLKYEGKVYMIGSSGLKQELDNAGIPNVGFGKDEADHVGANLVELASLPLDPEIKCVVVTMDMYFNYAKLQKAQWYLRQPNSIFVATNHDSIVPLGEGRALPGTGSIVGAVEIAAQRKAIVCGKPNRTIFDVAEKMHGIDPARTIMIGDRLDTDIELAHNCGLRGFLVLTGYSNLDEVRRRQASHDEADTRRIPHFYAPSLGHLGELLE